MRELLVSIEFHETFLSWLEFAGSGIETVPFAPEWPRRFTIKKIECWACARREIIHYLVWSDEWPTVGTFVREACALGGRAWYPEIHNPPGPVHPAFAMVGVE